MATATLLNSNCTVAQADAYFDERLNPGAWTGIALANIEDKDRALIQATRMLNTYLVWNPVETVDGEEPVPDPLIADATCELALVLLQGDTQVRDDMEGIESVKLSGMEVKKGNDKKRIIPPHVFKMISHLATYPGSGTIDVVRS